MLFVSCSSGTPKAASQDVKSTTTTESNEITSEKGGNDWDAVIDSYESYMDSYIKLMKKASSGDMSAMSEYAKMLEQAQEIQEKLNKAKNDLTPKQAARFAKIAAKMAEAAAAM